MKNQNQQIKDYSIFDLEGTLKRMYPNNPFTINPFFLQSDIIEKNNCLYYCKIISIECRVLFLTGNDIFSADYPDLFSNYTYLFRRFKNMNIDFSQVTGYEIVFEKDIF